MARMWWLAVISAGLAALLAYYASSITVPEGFSQPWKVRLFDLTATLNSLMMKPFYYWDPLLGARINNKLTRIVFPRTDDDPDYKVYETTFDGVPVLMYEPRQPKGKDLMPGVVYYHGGGWVHGSPGMVHSICLQIAKDLNAVVANVDYRLAPKHIAPAGFEDCVTAAKYFLSHAGEFNVDPTRVAVAGESAGGNLATVVSLKLRDEGFTPKLKQQVLVYPGVQFVDYLTPGVQQNKNTPLLKQSSMGFYASMYLFGNSSYASAISQNKHVPKDVRKTIRESYFNYKDLPAEFLSLGPYNDEIDENHQDVGVWPSIKDKIMSPYLSPLYAEDLSGLPDAFVLTCLYDPIRDGGYMYARRLKKYGIKVTYKNYKTGFHGVYNVHHMFKEGQEMLDDVVDHLKKEL